MGRPGQRLRQAACPFIRWSQPTIVGRGCGGCLGGCSARAGLGGRVGRLGLCRGGRRAPPARVQVPRCIQQADRPVLLHRQLAPGLLAGLAAVGRGVCGAVVRALAMQGAAVAGAVAGAMRRPVAALGGRLRVPAASPAPAHQTGWEVGPCKPPCRAGLRATSPSPPKRLGGCRGPSAHPSSHLASSRADCEGGGRSLALNRRPSHPILLSAACKPLPSAHWSPHYLRALLEGRLALLGALRSSCSTCAVPARSEVSVGGAVDENGASSSSQRLLSKT